MLKYYNAIILFLLVCSASNLSCSLLGIDSDITFPEKHHGIWIYNGTNYDFGIHITSKQYISFTRLNQRCYDFSNVWKIRRLKDGWYHLKSWGNKLRVKFDVESNGATVLKVNYYDRISIPNEDDILGFQQNTGFAEFELSDRDISHIMPICE